MKARRSLMLGIVICGSVPFLGMVSGCGYANIAVESVKCKACSGSGLCPVCGGDGQWGFFQCPTCSGGKTCTTCNGLGFQSP